MKKDIKLLALDLDGTTLRDDKTISEKNKAAIAAARSAGVHVVITTGRPLLGIQHYLEELDMTDFADFSVTYNGGLIQRNTGEILSKKPLSRAEAEAIKVLTEQLGIPYDILSEENCFVTPSERQSQYADLNKFLKFHDNVALADLPAETVINKIVSCTDEAFLDARLAEIPADFHEKFEIFKSQRKLLEFMPKGINKAYGLGQLIEILGLTQEQVAACGDEANDLSMIEWAGTGVAMKNAVDVVKSAANVILDYTNDEDGVGHFIEDYIL